jgi:hypothetical protein
LSCVDVVDNISAASISISKSEKIDMGILSTEVRTKFEQYLSGAVSLIIVQSGIQRLDMKHESSGKQNHKKLLIQYCKA